MCMYKFFSIHIMYVFQSTCLYILHSQSYLCSIIVLNNFVIDYNYYRDIYKPHIVVPKYHIGFTPDDHILHTTVYSCMSILPDSYGTNKGCLDLRQHIIIW